MSETPERSEAWMDGKRKTKKGGGKQGERTRTMKPMKVRDTIRWNKKKA